MRKIKNFFHGISEFFKVVCSKEFINELSTELEVDKSRDVQT